MRQTVVRMVIFVVVASSGLAAAQGELYRATNTTGGRLHPVGDSFNVGASIETYKLWAPPPPQVPPYFQWNRYQQSIIGPSLIWNGGSFLCMARTIDYIGAYIVQKVCDMNDSTQLWDFTCRPVNGVTKCVITQWGTNNCLYSPDMTQFQGVATPSIQGCAPQTVTADAYLWTPI